MFSRLTISLLLLSFWLLLSGSNHLLLFAFGIGSVVVVVWLCWYLDILGKKLHTVGFYLRLPVYLCWLSGRIILSNFKVAWIILSPKLPISPGFSRVTMTQRTDLGRLVHANSITLTPGTVSVDMDDQTIEVHSLSQVPDDKTLLKIDRRVSRLEAGH